MKLRICLLLLLALLTPWLPAAEPEISDGTLLALPLHGFFPGEKRGVAKRLNVYLLRQNGQWMAGLGTATVNGKPVWNTALMPVDASALKTNGGEISGRLTVTLVPDPWVPKDQKARVANVTVSGRFQPATTDGRLAEVQGQWQAEIAGDPAELQAAELVPASQGNIEGGYLTTAKSHDVADVSYNLAVYQLIPGQTTEPFQRRRGLSLGVREGKLISARLAQMDLRHNMYDFQPVAAPHDSKLTPDAFETRVAFTTDTLDGEEAAFDLQFRGYRMQQWLTGTWSGTYTPLSTHEAHAISGFFRGDVRPGAVVVEEARDERPWFKPVVGFQAPQAGEHPRLFFRQSDLPELRRRAATPEGQAIVKRLRQLLNGSDGESLPAQLNPARVAYPGKSDPGGNFKITPGAYTISHAAGFGFLYQLTGDAKYAGFARECVELGWNGQRDADPRYAWVAPGGELRAGPSLAWTAVAYDLCYDAWPEEFRRKVAVAIQDYRDTGGGEWDKSEGITLRKMVLQPKQGPSSNHSGAVTGGCGLAVLAIKNDPGTDRELLAKYLSVLERSAVRQLSAGWGDGGYYKEGWGASRVGTQGGFLSFLQALRTAAGHDYLDVERPNANFISMVPRCLMVLGPPAYFPYRSNMGGTYGNPEIGSAHEREGFSHGGYFSEGFGAIAPKYRPGLLWTWNHVFNADGKDTFDTASPYPHRAILALINWLSFAGVGEANPAEVMPLVTRDHLYEYFVFRNRFRDAQDIVTTLLINQPDGTKPREVMVWGAGGLRLNFGEPPRSVKVTDFRAGRDGSGLVSTANFALAVDYSGASGAEALVVTTGGSPPKREQLPSRVQATSIGLNGRSLNLLLIGENVQALLPRVEGDHVRIGDQTVTFADGNLVLGKFTPAP